jgi:hypothetical protein
VAVNKKRRLRPSPHPFLFLALYILALSARCSALCRLVCPPPSNAPCLRASFT